jgi:hypothetical protein
MSWDTKKPYPTKDKAFIFMQGTTLARSSRCAVFIWLPWGVTGVSFIAGNWDKRRFSVKRFHFL